MKFLICLLTCFFLTLGSLNVYPLHRYEYSIVEKTTNNSDLLYCFFVSNKEICHVRNLEYLLSTSLKFGKQNVKLRLSLDFTSKFSWIIKKKKIESLYTQCGANSSCENNININKSSLVLKTIEASKVFINDFNFMIVTREKGLQNFKGEGGFCASFSCNLMEYTKNFSQIFGIFLADESKNGIENYYKNSQLISGDIKDFELISNNETKISWVKIAPSQHFWNIGIKSLAIALTNDSNSKYISKIIKFSPSQIAILSLSTSFIGLPKKQFNELLEFLNNTMSNAKCKQNSSDYGLIYCQNMTFPLHFEQIKMVMDLKESNDVFHLDWKYLISKCVLSQEIKQIYKCKLNVFQTSNDYVVLGEPFFKNYILIFDSKNKKFGYFKAKKQRKQIKETLLNENSENFYKEFLVYLVALMGILLIFIFVILYRRKHSFLKKIFKRNKTKKYKDSSKIMNSFSKDDNDVKDFVREFEDNHNGQYINSPT